MTRAHCHIYAAQTRHIHIHATRARGTSSCAPVALWTMLKSSSVSRPRTDSESSSTSAPLFRSASIARRQCEQLSRDTIATGLHALRSRASSPASPPPPPALPSPASADTTTFFRDASAIAILTATSGFPRRLLRPPLPRPPRLQPPPPVLLPRTPALLFVFLSLARCLSAITQADSYSDTAWRDISKRRR